MISGNDNGKKGEMIVLLIFLLICSGLGIAAFTMSLMKKCSEGFTKGESNLPNGSKCSDGKSCESGSCTGVPCKCVPKDHLGEKGDYCNNNYQCKSGMCDAIGDMPTNKCLPEATCGLGPESPSSCEHGKCSNNKCILLDDGKNCEKASQCMSGICSKWNNQCIPGLPGDYCEVDDDCKSADQCGQYAPASCIKDPTNPTSDYKVCTDWTLNSPCSPPAHPPNSAGGIYPDCPNVVGQSGLRGQCKNNKCQLAN